MQRGALTPTLLQHKEVQEAPSGIHSFPPPLHPAPSVSLSLSKRGSLNTRDWETELCFRERIPGKIWKNFVLFLSFRKLISCVIVDCLHKFWSYLSSPSEPTGSLCFRSRGHSHLIQLILISGNKCLYTNLIRQGCFGPSWNGESWLITQKEGLLLPEQKIFHWNR